MAEDQGREALSVIHISVPRALKARWVKASQARGLKLTDWIIERVEREKGLEMAKKTFVKFVGGAWLDGKDVALYESAGQYVAAVETVGQKTLLTVSIGGEADLEKFLEEVSERGSVHYQDARRTRNALRLVGFSE